jgi:hypothetical protein
MWHALGKGSRRGVMFEKSESHRFSPLSANLAAGRTCSGARALNTVLKNPEPAVLDRTSPDSVDTFEA